jgi:hypothetical protein
MKVVAVSLFAISFYLIWWASSYKQFQWLLISILFIAIASGLFLYKKWAAYLWYFFALVGTLFLIIRNLLLAIQGWPIQGTSQAIISLFPGQCFITICVLGSVVVYRDYKIHYK